MSRLQRELRVLPRQFWLLSLGTLIYALGVEMCYPYEALYLHERLHVSSTSIGLILGITIIATLPMGVLGGAACDRWGRRPVLMVGICGSITLYLGLGLARQLWLIVVLITIEAAFGWAQYIIANNAMIADLTPLKRRAEAFSISRVALNLGITIGPLVAIPILALDPSFRSSFLVGGAICGVFLALVVLRFRETRTSVRTESVTATFRGYGLVLRDRRMFVFCLVALLPMFAFGQIWVTQPIMLGDLQAVTAQRWSLLLMFSGAATAALQYPVVRLLRHRDHLVLMAAASALIGLGLGAAAFVPWPGTFACELAICLGVVLLIPFAATVVSDLAPRDLRGRYMGAWTLVYMGGYALGPLVGGKLLDILGGRAAFGVTAAAGLAGAAVFLMLRRGAAFAAPRAETAGTAPEPPDVLADALPPEQVI
jgi:MFS family permease